MRVRPLQSHQRRGRQEPSVVVYCDGETRGYHTIPDAPPDAFAASAAAGVEFFRSATAAPLLDGAEARQVLVAVLAALDSSAQGGILVDLG